MDKRALTFGTNLLSTVTKLLRNKNIYLNYKSISSHFLQAAWQFHSTCMLKEKNKDPRHDPNRQKKYAGRSIRPSIRPRRLGVCWVYLPPDRKRGIHRRTSSSSIHRSQSRHPDLSSIYRSTKRSTSTRCIRGRIVYSICSPKTMRSVRTPSIWLNGDLVLQMA
jgi:hypothetical protein